MGKHAGYWIEDVAKHAIKKGWIRAKELDGTESMIYTTSENKIVKVWCMKKYAYNLSRGTERIMLHNFLFGSDTYLSVIGLTKIKGLLYFVLEQPTIDYIEESYNGLAIRKFLEKKFPNGHVDLVNGQFNVYLPEIIITDLHARNVVRTSKDSDNFHIIDCNIMFRSSNLGSLHWKDIKKQCNQRKKELKRLMKSPLFKNEILLIKQKYKPTKNR